MLVERISFEDAFSRLMQYNCIKSISFFSGEKRGVALKYFSKEVKTKAHTANKAIKLRSEIFVEFFIFNSPFKIRKRSNKTRLFSRIYICAVQRKNHIVIIIYKPSVVNCFPLTVSIYILKQA